MTGVSLIAAIPAAFLAYLLVMLFLNRFDQLATMLQVIAGTTLLACALVALMPVGILLFGPRAKSAEETEEGETAGGESAVGAAAGDEDLIDDLEPAEDDEYLADAGDEFDLDDAAMETDQDIFEESDTAEYEFDMDDLEADEDEKA